MVKKFLGFVALLGFISCGNNDSPDYDNSIPTPQVSNIPAATPILFSISAIHPHDPKAFTQGLEFYKGKLYEGTGEWGTSSLRIVDIKSGNVEQSYLIPDKTIFGEGITIFKNKIYQLTWQNHKIYVYNLNNIKEPIHTYNWSGDGWGATNDGNHIIISDGTSKLYYVTPDENKNVMKIEKILTVVDNGGAVDSLNELEFIDGFVFANRWFSDEIVKIDTSNGHVVGRLNLKGILQQYDPGANVGDQGVLNGIAYDSTRKSLFITGKYWPKLFELKLN